jgi:hypothetical protein
VIISLATGQLTLGDDVNTTNRGDVNGRLAWRAHEGDHESNLTVKDSSKKPTFGRAILNNMKAAVLEDLPRVFGRRLENSDAAILADESPRYTNTSSESLESGAGHSLAGVTDFIKDLVIDPGVIAAHKIADLVNPQKGKDYQRVKLSSAFEP